MSKIDVYRTHIEINDYEQGDFPALENMLAVYDEIYYTHRYIGLSYEPENKKLLIPRGIGINFLEKYFEAPASIFKSFDVADRATFKLNTKPRNDIQKKAISFLLTKNDYENIKIYSRYMLTLDTGVGKTYCTIAALSYIGYKSAIISELSLLTQWETRFYEYTNISEYDIYKIQGSASIKKLLKMKKRPYKIYLISPQTITSYANKNGWEAVKELFKELHIGVKVYDEAHKNMRSMLMIDMYTNTKRTIYLTATAGRSQYKEDHIFRNIFSNIPNFHVKRTVEDNYIDMVILQYNSKPSLLALGSCKGRKGMNGMIYMKNAVLGEGRKYYFNALKIIMNTIDSKLDAEHKVAILGLRKDVTYEIAKFIKQMYPHRALDIGIYNSDIEAVEKEKNLQKPIIISTSKSIGTGKDIPGLHYLVMTEPYSSKITAPQVSGRLRNIGGDLYYFEIVDIGYSACLEQFNKRKKYLLKTAKSFTIYKIK